MKTLLNVAVGIGLIIVGFLGGQVLRLKSDNVLKFGLPGGGQPPHCCYHAGGFANQTPACGNGVAVTPANFQTLCNVRCLGSYFNCP